MDINGKNLLQTKTYNVIYSVITNDPYVDQSGNAFLFENEIDATSFCNKVPDVTFKELANINVAKLERDFYCSGITQLKVKTAKSDNVTSILLNENDLKNGYYNNKTIFFVKRLLQTKQRKYATFLRKCKFIVPIFFDKRGVGEYPITHYCIATFDDQNEEFYVLFTTISEFEEWAKDGSLNFLPHEISLEELLKVIGLHGLLINPDTDGLALSKAHVERLKG